MSFSFWLYRADPGTPPLTEWPDMLARPLGSSAEVCQALAESLGGVEWRSGAVMERFALNYCCADFGDFRFPQLFDEHWNLL